MQNRYVGDIGDYSKFVLIKHLFDKKCGIIWYLYPNEGNGDGKFRNYANYKKKLKDYEIDDEIIDVMESFSNHKEEERNIQELEDILKDNKFDLTYFNECIDKSCDSFFSDYKKREEYREEWFNNALKKVQNCDVVFADPDNGTQIKIKSCPLKSVARGKYIYFNEIQQLLENHKTVMIYQHFAHAERGLFIDNKEQELREQLQNYKFNFYAIKFQNSRVYLILSKDNLKKKIEKFCNKFQEEFELIKES